MKYRFPKYPENWNEISKACLKRDGFKCTRCGCESSLNNRLNAHHIIPKSKGGRDILNNLKTLCSNCHKLNHPHMLKRKVRSKANGRKEKKKKIIFSSKRIPKILFKKT